MTGPLQGQNVLVIGRGSGLARAAVLAVRNAGAVVVPAGISRPARSPGVRGDGQACS